jgi:hypothetical protein
MQNHNNINQALFITANCVRGKEVISRQSEVLSQSNQ